MNRYMPWNLKPGTWNRSHGLRITDYGFQILALLLLGASLAIGGQPGQPGKVVECFYRCELDDTDQPYSLWLPRDYSPDKKWPLVVSLHGLGGSYRIGGVPREIEDCVVVAPDGRGNTDYKLWGETDVVRVVEEARKRLSIDPDRVYLYGISMGGSGSWQVGVHYPDLFAALGPVCGNADHRVWEKEWNWGERNPTWMSPKKAWVEATESPAFFAENLTNLPSWPIHGDKDNVVPCGHSRSMAEELKKAGAECHYVEVPGAGHGVPGDKVAEMLKWLKEQRRNPWPKRVVFKTAWRHHPGAYWVRVHRFERGFAFARIEAEAVEKTTIQVKTDNLEEFSLNLVAPLVEQGKPVRVTVNGRQEFQGQVPADGWLRLRKQGGKWQPSKEPERPLPAIGSPSPAMGARHKTPELEGPVQHAFMSSFVIVHGTQGDDERAKRVAADEAHVLANRWNMWSRGRCRVKADRDIKDEDIRNSSLILVGDPATNSLVPRVMPGLPIRIEGRSILFGDRRFEGEDLGLKIVYPNPLNPKRYVALFTGTTWRGVYQIVGRFGNWFDWGILDGWHWADFEVFDDHTYSPETCLAVGFFDNDWKLSPDWMVAGDEKMRLARPPRKAPPLRQPPEGVGEVYLSDLEPASANIEKGAVAYDRSFNAFPLTLGGRKFTRGLGVHPNCELAYDLGGRFSIFEAVVGTDLEDEPTVSQARDQAESFEFMVVGDGRMIFQTGRMRWDSESRHIYVPIAGVRRLELKIHRRSGPRWLSGPVDWAIAKVGEPLHNTLAIRSKFEKPETLAEAIPLDGAWKLAGFTVGEGINREAHRSSAEAQRDAVAAQVPSSVYAALDAAGKSETALRNAVNQEWWFWREFDVPREWAGRSVWVELDGAAYQADAWLNGRWIGRSIGPFAQGRFDATQAVKLGARNAVAIRVTSSPADWAKGGEPFRPEPASRLVTSHELAQLGYPMLGLWQPVRLRSAGPLLLHSLHVDTVKLLEPGAVLRLEAEVENVTAEKLKGRLAGTFELEGGRHLSGPAPLIEFEVEGRKTARLRREFPDAAGQLNWGARRPGAPDVNKRFLFRLNAAVELDNEVVSDARSLRFGIRWVALDPASGSARLCDGHATHDLRGAVWMPADAFLRLDRDHYRRLVERARECGFNALRVWGGGLAETDTFYDLCDEMGFLVIQEFPLTSDGQSVAPEDYLRNCGDIIRRLRRHPSLVAWGIGAAPPDAAPDPRLTAEVAALCRESDPERRLIADGPKTGPSQLWTTRTDPRTRRTYWTGARIEYTPGISSPSMPATLFARSGGEPEWPPSDEELLSLLKAPAAAAFGPSRSARGHILKAQTAQAAALQRILERRPPYGGEPASEILWQLNEPLASDSPALVDAAGIPKPAYYVLRREPPLVFADVGKAMPATLCPGERLRGEACVLTKPVPNATVSATFFDRALRRLASWEAKGNVDSGISRPLLFDWSPDASLAGDVVFLHLRLDDGAGKTLASNLYWLGIVAPRDKAAKPRLRVAWMTRPPSGRPSPAMGTRLPAMGAPPSGPLADADFLAATGIEATRPERKEPAEEEEEDAPAEKAAPAIRELDLEGYDAIVVDAATVFTDFTDADLKAVAAAVAKGCGLLVEGTDETLLDSGLGPLLPLGNPGAVPTGIGRRPVAKDPTHPAIRGLSFDTCPRLARREPVEVRGRAEVLVELDPEHPLLVETRHGQGRVLALATRSEKELAGWGDQFRFYAGMLGYLGRLPHRELTELVEAAQPAPLQALDRLGPARVEAKGRQEGDAVVVGLANVSPSLAFMVHLEAPGAPVVFSDNYVSLLPGESRAIRIERAAAGAPLAKPAVAQPFDLIVRGWNVAPSSLPGRLEIGDGKLRLRTP